MPLDTEPPREIPDDERILRDRKERQMKLKEAVMTLQFTIIGAKRAKR